MSSIQVQSLPIQQADLSLLPTICISKPSPEYLPLPSIPEIPQATPTVIPRRVRGPRQTVKEGRILRRESLRQQSRRPSALPSHMVKEILQTKLSKEKKEKDQEKKNVQSEADENPGMAPSQRRLSSVSSKSSSPEASPTSPPSPRRGKSKSKSRSKDVDWSDVTDPEERRRIQNRIAQRKFREKTRDNKEKAEREARNQQYAGNSYRTPTVEDFLNDIVTESDGLPWGGLSFGHAILRGHESEGRRSSGRGTYIADDALQHEAFQQHPSTQAPVLAPVSAPPAYMMPYTQGLPQAAGFAGEDVYMDDGYYGPVVQGLPPPPQ